ncbi:uncharacterized protein V6R79_008266 [Siganus canaliculatus]
MEMMKVKQVIVENEMKSTSAEIKSEPMMLHSYQPESLQCFQCFITFTNSKAKERHMKKSHREEYKEQLQQKNTLFTCYTCDKCFSSSAELSLHQTSHRTEEKPFHCLDCQKNFLTYTELSKHRRLECAERRFPCRDCGAVFPSPSRLRRHRMAVHPQCSVEVDCANTYQCCKCSRGFQTEEELLEHQETFADDLNCADKPQSKKRGRKPKHTSPLEVTNSKKIKQEEGIKEYEGYSDFTTEQCPSYEQQMELKIPCPEADCDLLFPSVVALRVHKRGVHGLPSCKFLTSVESNESYVQPDRSVDQSSEYTCLTCGQSFARDSVLKSHQNTHIKKEEVAEER